MSLPSLSAAIFTRANHDGLMPATSSSAARSSMILTGLPPADFESCVAAIPQRSGENLLPNPPPMYCCITWILPAGMPMGSAICGAMPERFWVDMWTSNSLSVGHSDAMPCDSRQQCVMADAP